MKLRLLIFPILLFGAVALSACDSGDPIDEPEPADVAGRYNFTQFTFQPNSQAVLPINVLDTLVLDQSHLDLSSGGNFILAYEFIQGDQFFLGGDFRVTATSVRISGSEDDRSDFNRLLLTEEFTLRRDADNTGVLTAEIPRTISDPGDYFDLYEGIESISGTLRMRLVKE